MILIGLFGCMLIIMLARVAAPIGVKIPGAPVSEVNLSFRSRMRLQRTSMYCIGIVILGGSLTQFVPTVIELFTILGIFAIMTIPVRYRLTSAGVALNHVVFRQWDEFSSVERSTAGCRLRAKTGMRDFNVVLAPDQVESVFRVLTLRVARKAGNTGLKEVSSNRSVPVESTFSDSTILSSLGLILSAARSIVPRRQGVTLDPDGPSGSR